MKRSAQRFLTDSGVDNTNLKNGRFIMEFEKMKEVIANVLNVDPEEITPETTFTEDLGADSLDLFQIIMGLEDEFDVQIDPEKTENITTVGEAVELLKNAIGK